MSFERIFNRAALRSLVFFTGIFCLFAHVASARGVQDSVMCDQAVVLETAGISRLPAPLPGEDLYLRIRIPVPGFLLLDVSVSGGSDAEPVLIPTDAVCDGSKAARASVLEREVASLALEVGTAGELVFRLASSDPSEALSDVKVHAGHSSFGEDEDEIEEDADPFMGAKPSSFGEDEDEIETEPNPFADPGKPSGFGEDEDEIEEDADPFMDRGELPSGFEENEDEIEDEPDPFADPGRLPSGFEENEDEIEDEPDPFSADGLGKAAMLCSAVESDDHADTLACASVLLPGIAVTGEIGNDWGDDADAFRLLLPRSPTSDLWRVELVTRGSTDTFGVLYDARGSRLTRSGSGGLNDNFRIVRVLRPGVYYIRVEGSSGVEGAYGLELSVSEP